MLALVDRGEHLLASVLTLLLLLLATVASAQLVLMVLQELRTPVVSWVGVRLTAMLGDVLNVLIALEVMQSIASYLRRGVVHLELVLVTAITAVARKVIVLPKEMENKPELLIGLGVVVLCLTLALALVRGGVGSFRPPARTGPTRPSPALDPWPAADDGDGGESTAGPRG